ncbi:MAG: hypothetical protein DMG57_12065 [Acidobacteria bacterium]|nr:MAG: hypothetical protein DMG57_12065 [Acidobacteriota bacterium]
MRDRRAARPSGNPPAWPRNHVFLPGHKMMVQIQSTWFPLYDRNRSAERTAVTKTPLRGPCPTTGQSPEAKSTSRRNLNPPR